MKQFRFAPIHFVMVSLILFGLLAILARISVDMTQLLIGAFLAITVMLIVTVYQIKLYESDELEQIQRLNDQAEDSLVTLLENMPIGVIKLHADTKDVEWFNPYSELMFSTDDGAFDTKELEKVLATPFENSGHYVTIGVKKYSVHWDKVANIVYFFDASSEYQVAEELVTTRPVIGIVSVDNYDDIEDEVSDSDISQINGFVANFLAEFADQYHMFSRRVSMDRFYLFTDYTVLDKLMTDKFSVIDRFREVAKEKQVPLTLSMGFSFGGDKHDEIGRVALQNLNLAEVRGGDQAVVKERDESKTPVYFGGGTASSVKRTRTRTRAMMTAIADKIKMADQVFVVGHRNLDMDALGATVGMQSFAKNIIDKAYSVYDPDHMAPDIQMAIESLEQEGVSNLLALSEAMTMVTRNSLLIMVDHSKVSLTLSEPFFEQFTQTIVIDHHRRDETVPNNSVITYIESGASSAAELVTELIQFQKSKKVRLRKIQASVMMAGIMLDTKNFTARVTSRTFDVASYLRNRGSDSVFIRELEATDFDDYQRINELILSGHRLLPRIIIASGSEEKEYDNVTISKAADTILEMAGIDASFVVAKNPSHKVSVSARSSKEINVQRMMEEIGGGGHFNLAAAQLEGQSIQEVRDHLESVILRYMNQTEESE